MKRRIFIAGMTLALLGMPGMAQERSPVAMGFVEAQVVDEGRNPVSWSAVRVTFIRYGDLPNLVFSGTTDSNGLYSAEGDTESIALVEATKDGYYKTVVSYEFTNQSNRVWQPQPAVVPVVLKKKLNPVAMYARRIRKAIPADGVPLGFDLEAGDWVGPHGSGMHRDFVFTLNRQVKSIEEFSGDLRLDFSRPGDGIQSVLAPPRFGSELRLPRLAPLDGYQAVWTQSFGRVVSNNLYYGETKDDQNYFYRVRSQVDDVGNVTNAYYGKISGEIRFGGVGEPRCWLEFKYYFNPDQTQNMEFDPSRNLALNLKPEEKVREP
jgi:hypothetical protein